MNVNKKLDRLKQWAGERMGGEAKTNVSDNFKALEIEMGLRHEGTRFPASPWLERKRPGIVWVNTDYLQAWNVFINQ